MQVHKQKKTTKKHGVSEQNTGASGEPKMKISLKAYPKTVAMVDGIYKLDNCSSRSEFIEKAVRFYIGYLNQNESVNYISPMITETVKATISGTEQRLARLLFKVAVELGKLTHLLAAANDVEDETLRHLQAMCVMEVRKINGIIECEDAVRYQQSD